MAIVWLRDLAQASRILSMEAPYLLFEVTMIRCAKVFVQPIAWSGERIYPLVGSDPLVPNYSHMWGQLALANSKIKYL